MRLRVLTLLASAGLAAGYGLQKLLRTAQAGEDAERRGRHAETPLNMPWLGWKDVLVRTWSEANDDRLLSVAATVAFFTVLSVAPAISVFVSLYGLFVEPSEIYRQISAVSAHLPAAAREIIEDQALRLTSKPTSSLSGALLLGLAVAAWSANAAIKALFDGLNVIYGETEKRSLVVFNALSLMTTLGAIILVMSALFVIAVAPPLFRIGAFAATVDLIVTWLRWPAFLVIASCAIAALYAIGPSRRPARWQWIAPGAVIAAFLWMASRPASPGMSRRSATTTPPTARSPPSPPS